VVLLAGLVVASMVAACGGGGSSDGEASSGDQAECPVDALAGARKPVTIRFWNVLARDNLDVLKRQTARFNSSQHDVRVELVQQTGYPELLAKYKAGLSTGSGDLPDLAGFEETTVQTLLDSHSTVMIQSCVDGDHYDLDDFVPRTISYYSVGGKLRAMPWTISNPLLIYNPAAFRKAGLDPNRPPRTLEEVKEYSERIVESGAAKHGSSLKIAPYLFEFLYAKSGQAYVNNGGGRDARATKALLDNPTGRAIWGWWKDMVSSGLAMNNGSDPDSYDHLLAIATGDSAMTFEASGALGPIRAVLESGQYPGVEIAAAPLPSLKGGGGVPVGDGAIWITSKTTPAKQAAAWRYVRFLVDTEQVAELSSTTGYVPIRRSAAESPEVQGFWKKRPEFKIPYEQLLVPGGPSADGSVIGDYQGVRDAVEDGVVAMLTQGLSPAKALARAQAAADRAIRDYNERIGA